MKIAVCFSGQPRTWERCVSSIKRFLECNPSFEYSFFGHTWTQNSWKVSQGKRQFKYFHEPLRKDDLYKKLTTAYDFEELIIDSPYIEKPNEPELKKLCKTGAELASNNKRPTTWNSMSYSAMMSNFLKQRYEDKHDMKFDMVIKLRLDQCFDPTYPFNTYLGPQFREDVLYCEEMLFRREFMLQSINDVYYFGSSRVMDIVDTFYRIYHTGGFFKLVGASYFDGAFKTVGYGPLLYKWLTIKNIHPRDVGRIQYQIVRRSSKITDGIADYNTLKEESIEWAKEQ